MRFPSRLWLLALSPGLLGSLFAPLHAQSNPVPFISQPLSPTSVAPGGPNFTLKLQETGFVSQAKVFWNGTPLKTKFLDFSHLSAKIPHSFIASAETANIAVVNPPPGGGSSAVSYFQVTAAQVVPKFQPSSIVKYPFDAAGAIVAGDFNGDGKPDFAQVRYKMDGNSRIAVFLGNGDGTFQPEMDTSIGSELGGLTTGDFNGDGKLDIAISTVANGAGAVAILLGNGDGTFHLAGKYSTGPSFYANVIAGDFNGDGRLDVATANYNSGDNTALSILLGNGDGSLQPPTTYSVGGYPLYLTVGDFNNDNKLDLAVTLPDSEAVSIFLGNGDGTFQNYTQFGFNFATFPVAIASADVNGDGNLDLIVGSVGTDSLCVLEGNGDGTFTPFTDAYNVPLNPNSVVTGDFNGDGALDIAVGTTAGVSILLGRGNGRFGNPATLAKGGVFIATGDFNGDGRLDIIGTSFLDFVHQNAATTLLLQVPSTP